ncbi:MAG TPA: hypothetical protein VFY45_04910 [Baekduia sp.]|nr:hypothetical protein [Baekduia sp.]
MGEHEAQLLDAQRPVGDPKRRVLIACLLHLARVRARDDVVTMLCKRIAARHNKARQRLEALREQHRADSERLIGVFGDVRAALDDDRAAGEPPGVVCERAGRRVLDALAAAGGVEELTSTQEAIAAHHGDNWLALLERPYRAHRACCSRCWWARTRAHQRGPARAGRRGVSLGQPAAHRRADQQPGVDSRGAVQPPSDAGAGVF